MMKRVYQQQLKDLEDGRGAMKDLRVAARELLKERLQEMLKQLAE